MVRIFCHHKIQQTLSIGYSIALRIQHTGHLPTYIYRCNMGADEADFDVGKRLMAVSENCREHRSMKLLNLGSSGRTHAAHICEMSVLGEYHCERVSIVPVPRIHEMVHQSPNCFLVIFVEHVSSRCAYILTSDAGDAYVAVSPPGSVRMRCYPGAIREPGREYGSQFSRDPGGQARDHSEVVTKLVMAGH